MTHSRPPIRIIVIDDHPVIRHGLINLFATEFDFKIVATCANGTECLQAVRDLKPDVALLDMSMPGMTGLDVLAALVEEESPTRVVFFAGAPEDREIVAALNGGAYGFLLKDAGPDELLMCLREAAQGQKCFPQDLVERARDREADRQSESRKIDAALTEREREVMLLIGQSLTNRETGARLHLAEGTVKLHLHSIYSKLGLRNRTALAAVALKYREAAARIKGTPRPGSEGRLASPAPQGTAPLEPSGKLRPGRPHRSSS